MKLGLLTAILPDLSFEEVVDYAASVGYECLEVACWPNGKAERRYAGVCHIDVDNLDDAKVQHINEYCESRNIAISSLAFYPNTLDPDAEKRQKNIDHLKKLIEASERLGVGMVTTFIGRDQNKNIEDNLEEFKKVWTPIIAFAEQHNVKVGIENCPMLFGPDQWPGGQNLAFSPEIWKKMFEAIPSDNFGLNYDPSHFVWQMMDYVKPIYEFKDKLFHIHFKDIKVFRDKLDLVGVLAYPLDYMSPKIPGLGDIEWKRFVSALTDIGYNGYACVEIEDKSFEDSLESVKKSIELSYRYMRSFVI